MATNMQISTIGEKAKAHCKDVQDQTLVINILQLVVKKGKKVQNIFSKQSVVVYTMHHPGP